MCCYIGISHLHLRAISYDKMSKLSNLGMLSLRTVGFILPCPNFLRFKTPWARLEVNNLEWNVLLGQNEASVCQSLVAEFHFGFWLGNTISWCLKEAEEAAQPLPASSFYV